MTVLGTSTGPSLAETLAMPGSSAPVLNCGAEEVMTCGVVALPVTASLKQAARAMDTHHVHGVLVVSCEGKPCGWVTAEHIAEHVGDDHLLEWALDAIGESFVAVGPSASVREVVAQLRQPEVSRVAVQKRPGLIPHGVISHLDIAAAMGRRGS